MKVQFFESDDLDELKTKINEYIKPISPRNVVKIEYNRELLSHEYVGKYPNTFFSYSVMIVTERPFEEFNNTVWEPSL